MKVYNVIYFMSNCPEIIFLLLNYLLNEILTEDCIWIDARGIVRYECVMAKWDKQLDIFNRLGH